jgi:hypothetical protein
MWVFQQLKIWRRGAKTAPPRRPSDGCGDPGIGHGIRARSSHGIEIDRPPMNQTGSGKALKVHA